MDLVTYNCIQGEQSAPVRGLDANLFFHELPSALFKDKVTALCAVAGPSTKQTDQCALGIGQKRIRQSLLEKGKLIPLLKHGTLR
jgi:hypothetical protein